MKHQRIRYRRAFWTMMSLALFKAALLLLSYWSLKVLYERYDDDIRPSPFIVFRWDTILPIVVLLGEAICYLVLRKRFFERRYVQFHLRMSFVSSFLFPILHLSGPAILVMIYTPSENQSVFREFGQWSLIIGWFLFLIARFFFIVAIVKSVTSLKEPPEENEPAGFLNDFAQ